MNFLLQRRREEKNVRGETHTRYHNYFLVVVVIMMITVIYTYVGKTYTVWHLLSCDYQRIW